MQFRAAPLSDGPPSDERVMADVRRGDGAALALIVRRHQASLQAVFRSLGLDRHGAEDCVQDTFVRLLRAAPDYEPRAPFRAFLLRLARNALVDWRRRRDDGVQFADPGDLAHHRERPAAYPAGDLMDLHEALGGLSEKLRAVVQLSIFDGLSYAEIALLLGIPVGTVKSRMFLAIRQLREALDRDAVA